MNWKFLDTFNTTAFKGWSTGWLWIYTGLVWGLAVIKTDPPTEWLLAWLGGLAAYSGIGAYQYGKMRDTDYGALNIKAGAPAPAQTTVNVAGSANVSEAK